MILYPLSRRHLPILTACAPRRARSFPIGLRQALCAVLLAMTALGAAAQPASAPAAASAPPTDEALLNGVRVQVDALQKALRGPVESLDLAKLRATALQAQADADAVNQRLGPLFASVQARLSELGVPAPGKPDPPDIAAQRAQLDKSRGTLDAQMKLSKLLSVEAEQAADQIWTLRRSQFQARLGERTDSIVGAAFWRDLAGNLPADARHAAQFVRGVRVGVAGTSWPVWASIAAGIVLVVVLRIGVGRWLRRVATRSVPPGRLRRSVFALGTVAVTAAAPGLIAGMIVSGITWNGELDGATQRLLDGIVFVSAFAGYITGLGQALLAADAPSWRLPPLPDPVAAQLRWFPPTLAVSSVLGWMSVRVPSALNTSLETAVAARYIVSLTFGTVLALALLHTERRRRLAALEPAYATTAQRPTWVAVAAGLVWLSLVTSLGCLLFGYVALGSFIVQQLTWMVVVAATAYLLSVLVEDVCNYLAVPRGSVQTGRVAVPVAATATLRLQGAVLVSGAVRLFICFLALTLVLAQFGAGPDEVFRRIGQMFDSIAIGEMQVRPSAVLQAVLVLWAGLAGVRLVKNWLNDRYLPTTGMDPGVRMSASTLFGYMGSVVVVALSLTAVGIGLERVAWVASALSVGIGFGLQAVVQNFVSGLILLAERPVKVGDWVSLGGVEGDIRRINVRATEIEMGDRSTVIVPNSEFITKTVRNVTHANPLGLVQIKLPMPLDTNVTKVEALLHAAFDGHPDILAEPAPSVALDGIENGALVFNATGFVSSPRATYGVRSALLFEMLRVLRAESLPMSKPPTMLLTSPAALPLPGSTAPAPSGAMPDAAAGPGAGA